MSASPVCHDERRCFHRPLNSFKKHQQRLARYQRRMSRKVKFSSNWKKAKARVQKIHTRIANARKDFLHKTTTTISQNHALVCIEDLQVRNMSKSSKGNSEQPGKMVKQKSGLNRSILDQGGVNSDVNWRIRWLGTAVCCWPPPHHTARHVRLAAMCRKIIGKHKQNSCASIAVTKITPIWSVRSIF
jgi:putative transposase